MLVIISFLLIFVNTLVIIAIDVEIFIDVPHFPRILGMMCGFVANGATTGNEGDFPSHAHQLKWPAPDPSVRPQGIAPTIHTPR